MWQRPALPPATTESAGAPRARLFAVADDLAYLAALRILKYRFNSEVELRRKLRGKRFEKDDIENAMLRLRNEKWLDDDRYAAAFVRSRANKRVGQSRIRRELQAAGVNQDSAQQAIAQNVDPEREHEALRQLCQKRARMLVRRHGEAYLRTSEGRNKLVGYLLKQGYDAGLVYEALKEITVVDHQPDS
jgi:regulatory protein